MAISMQELALETAEFLPDREVMSTGGCKQPKYCEPKHECPPPPECHYEPPCDAPCDAPVLSVAVGLRLSL